MAVLSVAEVALLQRLPRQHHIFDYSIPPNLQGQIKSGDLVEISFRKKNTFGIVTELKSHSSFSKKIKSLDKLVVSNFVSPTQLKLSRQVAGHYGVTWGAALNLCIPHLPNKNFIPDLSNFKIPKIKPIKPVIIPLSNQIEHLQTVLSLIKKVLTRQQQVLLLVPEINLIKKWHDVLQPLYSTITYSADLSTIKQRKSWLAANSSKTKIIIGTRGAIFLPFINFSKPCKI